jgi:hypothetical protein
MSYRMPETIETDHFRADYSLMQLGYRCAYRCAWCGREGTSVVRDFDPRIGLGGSLLMAGIPAGWGLARHPSGPVLPRCEGCTGAAAERIALEMLAMACA